ncbi:MAG: cytochrome c-type biogenesis protein CcmH [Methylococcales bacterium]|jgi:cytochrome c-type biogenesis protein CcmH|nr:cytochrome c-type biogenesis protein CcmH [Methylococcales bacterium]
MRWFVFMCLTFSACFVQADVIDFKNKDHEYRYHLLTKELRCAKCQNQNLADSHAELAGDMRVIVLEMIESGKTNREIRDYMVARYGKFILYRPPVDSKTMLLWFAPLLLLLGVIGFVIKLVKQRQKDLKPSETTDDENEKLTELLQENNQKDAE